MSRINPSKVNKASFATALREALHSKGLQALDVADRYGMRPSAVTPYLKGTGLPGADKLTDLVDWLEIDRERILSAAPVEGDTVNSVTMPVYDMTAGAGDGGVVVSERVVANYVVDEIDLRALYAHRPRDPYAIQVIGDSMEPVVFSGERVIIEPYERGTVRFDADAIYLLRIEDAIQLKQLERKLGGIVVIKSINPRYASYDVDLNQGYDFEILGRMYGKFRRY